MMTSNETNDPWILWAQGKIDSASLMQANSELVPKASDGDKKIITEGAKVLAMPAESYIHRLVHSEGIVWRSMRGAIIGTGIAMLLSIFFS
jgi:hypothetical protein